MPPHSRQPAGPKRIAATEHADKRINNPTADAAEAYEYVAPIRQAIYERRSELDPQLVWRGKPEQDETDLLADAPPIYIQEKIDPRALVEILRRTGARPHDEPELMLFEGFDGLDEVQQIEFYAHDANWSNRMILGDSLQVMASLAEQEHLRGRVQMIYIDPPYGIKFGSNWQASTRNRDVKDGRLEDAAREVEQIKAFRDTWELGIHSYLSYLRDRLTAARELLTESGSVFVQISEENVHLVRSLMDEVLGSGNFIANIAFAKSGVTDSDVISRTHDFILWYGRNKENSKTRRLWQRRVERTEGGTFLWLELVDGTSRRMTQAEKLDSGAWPEGSRAFRASDISSQGASAKEPIPVVLDGRSYLPSKGRHWNARSVGRAAIAGRVLAQKSVLGYKRFEDDFPFMPISHVWNDTVLGTFSEKFYVVQTGNLAVQRCMLLCTDPGDLVLDPTCGSGTTAYVAEQWGRRWITIDTSRVALALARQRLMGARFPYYVKADSPEGRTKEQSLSARPLPPAETRGDIKQGFVCERVQHITLKSIANNPDIREAMSREEIDAAIKRHADFEMLYDRPYEDKSKVRVTGRFTVESLSPHRAISPDEAHSSETIDEYEASLDPSGPTFEQSILDNLRNSPIQTGRKDERITFESLDTYPGIYLQAVGERVDTDERGRVGIAIGPQYGTVSTAFLKSAAKEAIAAGDIDSLAVLGFAFDPQVLGFEDDDVEVSQQGFANVAAERRLGKLRVAIVRMNVDLLMGEDLKKSGAGNLFTVFGEPDIEVRHEGEQVMVEIKGVDVFDPTTGRVRSNDTSQIALWMIDTAYDEESFFVRHCYFTGGNDPYKRLKTALKADIDADAWESLYRTESRPFPPPAGGKIAVKVINDYGDEVMKVFEV